MEVRIFPLWYLLQCCLRTTYGSFLSHRNPAQWVSLQGNNLFCNVVPNIPSHSPTIDRVSHFEPSLSLFLLLTGRPAFSAIPVGFGTRKPSQILTRFDELLRFVCEDSSWILERWEETPHKGCCFACVFAFRRITL